ncbi:hypothetical protein Tco_0070721 [Tanacetum coccineum]
MGDVNPIRTLRDYSKPSHEGYRNTIKLPIGNNVLERLPAGSITTWKDLTTRFLAQFFPPGRTAKTSATVHDVPNNIKGISLRKNGVSFQEYLLQKVLIMASPLVQVSNLLWTMSIPSQDEPLNQ